LAIADVERSSYACVAEEKREEGGAGRAGQTAKSAPDFFTYIAHNSLKNHDQKK
jgi:hypothetical protein